MCFFRSLLKFCFLCSLHSIQVAYSQTQTLCLRDYESNPSDWVTTSIGGVCARISNRNYYSRTIEYIKNLPAGSSITYCVEDHVNNPSEWVTTSIGDMCARIGNNNYYSRTMRHIEHLPAGSSITYCVEDHVNNPSGWVTTSIGDMCARIGNNNYYSRTMRNIAYASWGTSITYCVEDHVNNPSGWVTISIGGMCARIGNNNYYSRTMRRISPAANTQCECAPTERPTTHPTFIPSLPPTRPPNPVPSVRPAPNLTAIPTATLSSAPTVPTDAPTPSPTTTKPTASPALQICTPGDIQFCHYAGACAPTGGGCICNFPDHFWSSEHCAVFHPPEGAASVSPTRAPSTTGSDCTQTTPPSTTPTMRPNTIAPSCNDNGAQCPSPGECLSACCLATGICPSASCTSMGASSSGGTECNGRCADRVHCALLVSVCGEGNGNHCAGRVRCPLGDSDCDGYVEGTACIYSSSSGKYKICEGITLPTTASAAAPTLPAGTEMLHFSSLLRYEDVTWVQMEEDRAAQRAAIAAAAVGFGHHVATDQLEYANATATSTISQRRRLTTGCIVAINVLVPLRQIGIADAEMAYANLTGSLRESVVNGVYAASLADASAAFGATATRGITISSVVATQLQIFEITTMPSQSPTAAPTQHSKDTTVQLTTIVIVLCSLAALLVCWGACIFVGVFQSTQQRTANIIDEFADKRYLNLAETNV